MAKASAFANYRGEFRMLNGTSMGTHMSCSYSDIAMYRFDIKVLNNMPGVQCWKSLEMTFSVSGNIP